HTVKGLTNFGVHTRVEFVQCLQLRPQGVVLPRTLQQLPDLLQDPSTLRLSSTTRFLEDLHAREKSWELFVAQLQRLLGLHHDVGIEEALDFTRAHPAFPRRSP